MASMQQAAPSTAFVGASWMALLIGATTYLIGLWNAALSPSEKGFYAMGFVLSLFAAIAVQKNVRDAQAAGMHKEFSVTE